MNITKALTRACEEQVKIEQWSELLNPCDCGVDLQAASVFVNVGWWKQPNVRRVPLANFMGPWSFARLVQDDN